MALVVIAASFAFSPSPSGGLVLPLPAGIAGGALSLPPLCPLKGLTGFSCPGCGMTRSFVAVAHGRLETAWFYNRVGIALFFVAVYQVFYRPWMIRRGEVLPPEPFLGIHKWVGNALIAALLLNWLWNVTLGAA